VATVFLGQFNLAYHFCSKFAYVDGFFVNYYDFVFHIVDLLIIAVILWYLIIFKLWKHKRWKTLVLTAFSLWTIHNMIFRDWIVLYWSFRLLLYVIAGVSIRISVFKFSKKEKKNLANWLFGSLAVVGVIQSVIVGLQFLLNRTLGIHFLGESFVQSGISGTSSVILPNGTFLRGYGTFPHPNIVGGFISISIMVVSFRLLFGVNKKRFWLFIPLIFLLVGLVFTWSRSAWLFTLLSLILSFYLFLRTKKKEVGRKILGSALIVLGLFTIWISVGGGKFAVSLRERVIEQTLGGNESVVQRRQLNQRAIDMYRENILTGVGAGNFIARLRNDPVLNESGLRIMQPAHNIFLLGAAELGFMALWILSYYLYSSIKGIRTNIYYLFPLLFLLVVGNVDHYPITLPQGLLLLLVLDWFVILQKSIYTKKKFR
jgi:O-antigen ligase